MNIKKTYKPTNLEDILDLLDRYGEKAKLLAGGTDLVIGLKNNEVFPEVLIDIFDVQELKEVNIKDGYIEMGSAVTFSSIYKSNKLGDNIIGLKEAAHSVGSPQIRNRGTIGGNICNGSPAADTVPPLLALGAIATIKSKNSEREVPLENLFLDKGKVDIKPNEILYSVKFKELEKNQVLSFSKLGLRKALAISRICTSLYVDVDDNKVIRNIRIGSGALGKYCLREKKVEEFLINKKLEDKTILEGSDYFKKVVEERLKGRSTVEFKSEAVKGIFKEAMNKALELITN
ncbi:nicotinate dehydrogenase FAD-subunit [Gottschalkia purinilytica]|uniref:Nicotinate dehydrogenase FAD-subunit n=1 Tax=Gottschalkia purinilytica TaxID=1503 RepID=A0A0L0W6I7_GOTPU|nr:FAD binding domain-containing protein [Gottschalkia purinilytica]KNF07106.1 nicotinate dehydrogenase FAD-subunit [Gottschalkia purinilytica]